MAKRDTSGWPAPRQAGYEDGYAHPDHLSFWLTYDDADDSEDYDFGVNLGQHDGAADAGKPCQACRDGHHELGEV